MRFKKLRKIFRILFPIHISSEKQYENWLYSNFELLSLIKQKEGYLVTFKDNLQVFVRDEKYSDVYVLDQIFNKKEYGFASKLIALNSNYNKDVVIIDAGANVGYTSLYFNQYLPEAKIFAIEPSPENAKCFSINIGYLNTNNIKLYECALSHAPNINYAIDRSFRDGKDWSIATSQSENGTIKGISLSEIINENQIEFITLLKIDIEGAERFIFSSESDLSFLNKTKILAVEIHDEYNIRSYIYEILREYNFLIFESGELTIGINKHFIDGE